MVFPVLTSGCFTTRINGAIMRCLSCNCNLSDREANRKYENWELIKTPEQRYIGLCDDCLYDTDLVFEENPNLSNENYDAELPIDEDLNPIDNEEIWSER